MDGLDFNTTHKIKTHNFTYYFNFDYSLNGYYINFIDRWNDVLFTEYNIDKEKFSKEILGYYIKGMFPFCRTIADCEKLLMALIDKIREEREPSIFTDFIFKNLESYWND